MVRIIDYKQYTNEDGESFFALELQGGIEMVKSQKTERFYATARKVTIPSTFNEETCKSLIGTEMPGRIVKVETEPYEYTLKETGEVIELSHRYEYQPEIVQEAKVEKSSSTLDDFVKFENPVEQFSTNGVM
ncbi:hypothetical protein [Allomuricauda sp. ARW1Y1]|jgi:hypothetical protein|uniref:hypothetical protein n=1 Tax=Allomuricauda sp. ARW1Y1 TaxID=2663843 RepID=UPI0015CCC237|nr:hypothetical protein [Muricauda sp. ARW1Y1]NYJ26627.1 hypothetical protein [Muricauda sp. ARW1Y1]